MSVLSVSSERLRLQPGGGDRPSLTLVNRMTGLAACRHGVQTILVRTPLAVSEPAILSERGRTGAADGGMTMHFSDRGGKNTADLHLSESLHGIRFRISVRSASPVWLVEWKLSDLHFDQVVVPALGGQSLGMAMPQETTLSYKYPFWWNAQFVIGRARRGGIWLRAMDVTPVFKILRIRREGAGFTLTYAVEATAPIRSRTLDAVWYIDGFDGDWRGPVDMHRRWMEDQFGLLPRVLNPSIPVWAHDLDCVLEIWGARKDREEPHHTFGAMIGRLREWKKLHDPGRTLVYLPGFANHGIDSCAPDYEPGALLGGPQKFRQLVSSAHAMGYKVMMHTNAIAMTYTHPEFRRFRKHQVVDTFGRRQGWALDIDGDWLTEPYFAYINPGVKAWGDLMERTIGSLLERYRLDGVFLDQTLLAFNVSRGPDFVAGMRSFICRLRHVFPNILFAGEGMHEQVVKALPMAQIHGLDSLTEIHGTEAPTRWRKVHPVSTYLFGPYTRFVGHLLTKHPRNPMFAVQEAAYAKLGVLPVLALYHETERMDLPAVRRMIRRAETLHD